ncbi:ARMC2-like protein [Mya arenaria]|nr:ARMC2-like protein [Mya arenaria]
MDPTPPRKPKENRPFYAPPEDKPSAVQIINEARSSLKELKTKRPFTPREDRRTLFGPRPVNTADNRPPSAFSLDSRHFDPDSRPVSGTRLSPLDHKPSISTVEEDVARLPTESEVESLLLPPKPPTDSGKPSKTRARARYANSGDNSSADRVRSSGSETDIQSSQLSPEYEGVGALEDGSLIYPTEERGEGDGKEAPPHRAPSKDAEKLISLSEELYQLLLKNGLLVKTYKQRSRILKAIFKMLDLEEPKLLLQLARLILAFRVGGNNLLNVCKLVFKVSRNEKNDPAFLDGNILGNATIAKQLVGKQCIEKLSTLLDNIIKLSQESGANTEQLGNILVQLTAALRNLADASSSRDRILGCRLLESLTAASDSYSGDAEIVLNVSRIFSKVTLHTDCCLALSGYSLSYKVFLHLLKKHLKRQDIVVRVCFILGNMTAKNDEARVCLYQESKSLEISHSKPERKSGGSKDEISKTEDVLVKVVRVIANISINETVGPQVASSKACVELLIRILDYKDVETSEELVLNTVACINNLSYFSLMKLILAENMMKSIVEVSRVFGNLTRQKQVRDYLHKEKVDVLLCTLLDSGDKEVVYIACGVLINFMVLRDCGRGDWELAGMVCQTLWNYSGKITSTNACFGETESQELSEILIDFLDKESAFDPGFEQMDPEFQDYILDTWESQFCPVADQLLQRIETHNSDFEPL